MRPERHPWNRAFTWPRHAGPFRAVTDEQARAYDELGFFVLADAIDLQTLADLDTAIAPFDREVVEFLRTKPDGRFSIAGIDSVSIAVHLVRRSKVLRDFAASPLLAGLCADLVGPDVRLYWDQSVCKKSHSAEPFLWHQDNGYTYVEPPAYLTCWVAITDATPDNGCISVVPGLHRMGTLAHRSTPIGEQCLDDPPGAVQVPVRAGSVVIFSSLTPHATGYNTTDTDRMAYILQYAPDGAVALRGDPAGGPGTPEPQTHAERQFVVVRAGDPVGAHN